MKKLALVLVGAATVLIAAVTRQFLRDDTAARARLDAVPRRVIDTDNGKLEYAEVGDGEPVLAIHGIFGGCDAGLLSFGDSYPTGGSSHRPVSATSARPSPMGPPPPCRPTPLSTS